MAPSSVTVPEDGWLWVSVGMRPEAWEKEGDGIKFLVGVSDGRAFEQLFAQHLNPFANHGDRKWIPVRVDLSTYAGEEVEIIPFTERHAEIARAAHRRFGRGNHPAKLNYGDCLSYALARALGEPLLFAGDDFSLTDIDVAPY